MNCGVLCVSGSTVFKTMFESNKKLNSHGGEWHKNVVFNIWTPAILVRKGGGQESQIPITATVFHRWFLLKCLTMTSTELYIILLNNKKNSSNDPVPVNMWTMSMNQLRKRWLLTRWLSFQQPYGQIPIFSDDSTVTSPPRIFSS